GLKTCATLSAGDAIANPCFLRAEKQALAKVQRRLFTAEHGTPERAKRRKVVARVHERIAWRRREFTHQHSHHLVNAFALLAVEDVSVKRLVQNPGLAKSLHDAAWSQFARRLSYQAAWAGRKLVAVNPAVTSQDCAGCGHRQARSLADRTYIGPCCGLVIDRDLTARKNILAWGHHCLASAEKLPDSSGGVVTRDDFFDEDNVRRGASFRNVWARSGSCGNWRP